MHPRTEEVLNYLEERRADLRAAVDSVPVEMRNKQPGADRWSVAQVLDHLTIIDRRVTKGVRKWIADAQAAGLGPETDTSSVLHTIPSERITDRSRPVEAPEMIRPSADIDAEQAWSQLVHAREELRSAFLTGDGQALTEVVQPHPVLGPINIYQWLLFSGSHEARHTLQVREIADSFKSAAEATA
jgi:DinB superfamily